MSSVASPSGHTPGPGRHVASVLIGLVTGIICAGSVPFWWHPLLRAVGAEPPNTTCHRMPLEVRAAKKDQLAVPTGLTVHWDKAPAEPGHVTATVRWINQDSRTVQGLVQVTGRYGDADQHDLAPATAGRQLPANGTCGRWYRLYSDPAAARDGVVFSGLWPDERYCFSVDSASRTGSKSAPYPSPRTPGACEIAPWGSDWGSKARPDNPSR